MNLFQYTTKSALEISREFKVSPRRGLQKSEAERRLKQYGKNEIKKRSAHWWNVFLRQFKSPFIYLLLGASFLSFVLGERTDGLMILFFVGINTILGFYQEHRSEKTLELLKKYTVSYVKVLRDGKENIIRKEQLAPGDIVILEVGNQMPADLRFLEINNLLVDESILSGESAPVEKTIKVLDKEAKEIYNAKNLGFAGTIIVRGKAKGLILKTGRHTAFGRIAHLAAATRHRSDFEKGIARFSRFTLYLVSAAVILIFFVNFLMKGEEADPISFIIFSVALAVSVIPEALPLVITFSLSRGALRLAKEKTIVRRLSAIEDLGGIEILCADKTGTLTKNALTLKEFSPFSSKDALMFAAASAHLTGKNKDPFDLALLRALSQAEKEEIKKYQRREEIPFDPRRRWNAVLIERNKKVELIVRGAPEVIIKFCSIDKKKAHTILRWFARRGEKGERALAVARRNFSEIDSHKLKDNLSIDHKNLEFLGAISFYDPLKSTARATIREAEELGVKIKILTGDSREVAGSVAKAVGLISSPQDVLTGEEFEAMDAVLQHEAILKYSVFARVLPEQKYKIVRLLEEKHNVGFLGEGINDAPALKLAGVSLVVDSASDIAREAADIVLLEKNLKVIIDGIRRGREIFENTIKYIKITLVSNFGNFFAVAGVSFFINFLPMLPLQLLLLNLLSDFPLIAISTDQVNKEEISRPKQYNVRDILLFSGVLGSVSTIFDFIFFALFYKISPAVLQTNWFIGSALTEIFLLFFLRTRRLFFRAVSPSAFLLLLTGLAAFFIVFLPFTKFAQNFFRFAPPTPAHLFLIFGVVAAYLIISESVKLLYYRHFNQTK